MNRKPEFVIPPNIQKRMLNPHQVVEFISDSVKSTAPFMFSRFGSIEGEVINSVLLRNRSEVGQELRAKARNNAGIAKPENATLNKFSVEYMASISNADLLGIWNFPNQIKLAQFTQNPYYCHLNHLDPIFLGSKHGVSWTQALDGMRVLVIHPFAESIRNQVKNKANINLIRDILPPFKLITHIPPQTTQRTDEVANSWYEELKQLKLDILQYNFDVAIIGAGAYGAPIASFIKSVGGKALHLGGVTQLMFGIIGKRWESRPHMKDVMTEGWSRPLESEKHENAGKIEGGCYW
ncbi:hypothetical protein OPS25_06020 [Alteromonas ponticola]|uniref:GT-D fold-like domain-containing protein n=1 Tax=Alteromonas aquimaris TaxID=2998417 RepID=A0ABT3P5M2_9ALTE|nr:hypothetical protein [Alteromonas aquimaris]MCW8108050.1 hypothetical protein [Alteromonas aquimaris]